MIEENFGQVQEDFAAFVALTPKERFKSLLMKRPYLIARVPQHQLGSYLGITPESLSRIKPIRISILYLIKFFLPLNSNHNPKPNSPTIIGTVKTISSTLTIPSYWGINALNRCMII